ncbi:hypothetical protein [Helicobacter cappadocius]|uniref:Uncharacterized protein n=1 Tax=Helicobacter cappadocius TaxID=3063998 RepID=A0AA90PIF0_9HELI|nr:MULTISPECIES: hypothetical protein [unclassified Helicobacter]MDO7252789.1 hypothetical protein [Helicobacter sp. faydin-H75]MDP2538832.1 hypothetical protein [Helicobacter sp. faydin-H76]
MKTKYSIGVDTFRFVISKDSLEVFLRKKDLYAKIRKSTRNIQIHEYVSQKFKSQKTHHPKHPFDVKYINLKRGNKSLSNTILLISNSITCHQYSKANKKGYEHYVEVVFAGLHQPSKNIDSYVFKALKAFLKRFKTHSLDLASDFDYKGHLRDLLKQTGALNAYMAIGARSRNEGDSIYINETIRKHGLRKILLYDKYKKQKFYHKENIQPDFIHWKRCEIVLEIKERFFRWIEYDGLDGGIALLNDMALKMGVRGIIGLDVSILSKQIMKLKDLRRSIDFKALALQPKNADRLKSAKIA